MKILLVEDDEVFVERLSADLIVQNHTVDAVDRAELGWEYAQSADYDLIVLDINLPDTDGITLCQQLRKGHYGGSILLLTAKNDSTSKVQGLDAGADDYVVKPCTTDELCARIRALLRRPRELPTAILHWGDLQLDLNTCQVRFADKQLSLSPKEYGLLELFLHYPQRIFSSEVLLERLWSFDETPGEETVRTHIKRLRRKLRQAGAEKVVENVYGMGYRLATPPALDDETLQRKDLQAKAGVEGAAISPASLEPSLHAAEQARAAATAALQQFQPLIVERLAAITAACNTLQTGLWTDSVQSVAYHAAHKLSGSLGLFGLMTASQISQQIELLLQPGNVADTQHIRAALPPLSQQLQNALESVLGRADVSATSQDVELASPAATATQASPEALLPKLLVISADDRWMADLQSISVNFLTLLNTEVAHLSDCITSQRPDMILLDMAAWSAWQDCLKALEDLKLSLPQAAVAVIPLPDTFEIRLAIARCHADSICLSRSMTNQQILSSIVRKFGLSNPCRHHVLVVDDDPLVLASLANSLPQQGLQVTTLENPAQLWDTLALVNPDLLLLDFEMPEVNGIELCQIIRSDRHWQHLPIVFLSGRRDPEIVQQMYGAGADDYIEKPFVDVQLAARISNRIMRSQTLRQ